jgi:hypothetical protein
MANQKHTNAELDAALQEHEANLRRVAGLLQRVHGLSATEARAEAEEIMNERHTTQCRHPSCDEFGCGDGWHARECPAHNA